MTKPPANVLDLPLEVRTEMALKAAVEKAILEHARQGLPIYVWRDGEIVKVLPEELQAESSSPDERSNLGMLGFGCDGLH